MFAGLGDLSRSLGRQSQLVAVVCLVADVAPLLLHASRASVPPWYWFLVVAVVLADLALAAPARFSGQVAVVHALVQVAAAVILPGHSGTDADANDAGSLIAGYRAGAWLRGGPAILALVALICGVVVGHALSGETDWADLLFSALKGAVLPWLVGRYTTARRAHLAELEQRAENERRDAQHAIARAVTDERGAIARDLHDVISHHVSAIGVHAGAARLGLATSSGEVVLAKALSEVESSSQAALMDLRRMLDLLHGDDVDGARQPGLDNLDELVDGVRAAGMAVRTRITGVRQDRLSGSLDVALYRITQEMLTNALRHGDGTTVDLRIDHEDHAVTLSSENAVHPYPAREPGAGNHRGLAGIRHRAALFDGDVSYGPDPDGRAWRIAVVFPLAPAS
jgi:signal transduction histidine kinase